MTFNEISRDLVVKEVTNYRGLLHCQAVYKTVDSAQFCDTEKYFFNDLGGF